MPMVRTGGARLGGRLTFSSDIQATVVVNAVAADVALPGVVIPAGAIPPGATISRVLASVTWRKSVESSAAPNAVNGAQAVQVRSDAPGTWRNAIDLADNSLDHAANATEGGMMLVGDNDLSVEVTGADTYELQWEQALVDGASITFHDWQCHLLVEYE